MGPANFDNPAETNEMHPHESQWQVHRRHLPTHEFSMKNNRHKREAYSAAEQHINGTANCDEIFTVQGPSIKPLEQDVVHIV